MSKIQLRCSRTTRALFAILGVLLVLHLIVVISHLVLHTPVAALSALADLDLESNLPTFYNAMLFFLAGALFFLHGKALLTGDRWGWYLMGAVLFMLGVDEGSQVHEKFLNFTKRLLERTHTDLDHSSWLEYAWVIPYSLAGLILLAIISRWLGKLASKLRWQLVFSGTVYVLGAVCMEMVGSKIISGLTEKDLADSPWLPCEVYGDPSGCWLFNEPSYIAAYTLEETLEMTGLILCIHFLLKAFEDHGKMVSLGLEPVGTDS